MYKGYQEAQEHQEEESADTAAVNHGGREGMVMSDRAKASPRKLLNQQLTLGEEQEKSRGERSRGRGR